MNYGVIKRRLRNECSCKIPHFNVIKFVSLLAVERSAAPVRVASRATRVNWFSLATVLTTDARMEATATT